MQRILTWDKNITQRLRIAEKPGWLRRFASILAHSGDSWFWIVGMMIVAWLGTPGWRWRMVTLIIAVIVTAVLVLAVKFTVRRSRPEGEWGEIYRSSDPHSFPSGHAARAFLLAALAVAYGPPWFAVILVVWAPLVSLARVAMGVHYFSDVFVGGVVGILMGWIISSIGTGEMIANLL